MNSNFIHHSRVSEMVGESAVAFVHVCLQLELIGALVRGVAMFERIMR